MCVDAGFINFDVSVLGDTGVVESGSENLGPDGL